LKDTQKMKKDFLSKAKPDQRRIRSETAEWFGLQCNLRVSSWSDKVEADMNTGVVVGMQRSLHLQLLLQVGLILGVNVVHNCLVAKTRKHITKNKLRDCHFC